LFMLNKISDTHIVFYFIERIKIFVNPIIKRTGNERQY
jgi:hypothetical protein